MNDVLLDDACHYLSAILERALRRAEVNWLKKLLSFISSLYISTIHFIEFNSFILRTCKSIIKVLLVTDSHNNRNLPTNSDFISSTYLFNNKIGLIYSHRQATSRELNPDLFFKTKSLLVGTILSSNFINLCSHDSAESLAFIDCTNFIYCAIVPNLDTSIIGEVVVCLEWVYFPDCVNGQFGLIELSSYTRLTYFNKAYSLLKEMRLTRFSDIRNYTKKNIRNSKTLNLFGTIEKIGSFVKDGMSFLLLQIFHESRSTFIVLCFEHGSNHCLNGVKHTLKIGSSFFFYMMKTSRIALHTSNRNCIYYYYCLTQIPESLIISIPNCSLPSLNIVANDRMAAFQQLIDLDQLQMTDGGFDCLRSIFSGEGTRNISFKGTVTRKLVDNTLEVNSKIIVYVKFCNFLELNLKKGSRVAFYYCHVLHRHALLGGESKFYFGLCVHSHVELLEFSCEPLWNYDSFDLRKSRGAKVYEFEDYLWINKLVEQLQVKFDKKFQLDFAISLLNLENYHLEKNLDFKSLYGTFLLNFDQCPSIRCMNNPNICFDRFDLGLMNFHSLKLFLENLSFYRLRSYHFQLISVKSLINCNLFNQVRCDLSGFGANYKNAIDVRDYSWGHVRLKYKSMEFFSVPIVLVGYISYPKLSDSTFMQFSDSTAEIPILVPNIKSIHFDRMVHVKYANFVFECVFDIFDGNCISFYMMANLEDLDFLDPEATIPSRVKRSKNLRSISIRLERKTVLSIPNDLGTDSIISKWKMDGIDDVVTVVIGEGRLASMISTLITPGYYEIHGFEVIGKSMWRLTRNTKIFWCSRNDNDRKDNFDRNGNFDRNDSNIFRVRDLKGITANYDGSTKLNYRVSLKCLVVSRVQSSNRFLSEYQIGPSQSSRSKRKTKLVLRDLETLDCINTYVSNLNLEFFIGLIPGMKLLLRAIEFVISNTSIYIQITNESDIIFLGLEDHLDSADYENCIKSNQVIQAEMDSSLVDGNVDWRLLGITEGNWGADLRSIKNFLYEKLLNDWALDELVLNGRCDSTAGGVGKTRFFPSFSLEYALIDNVDWRKYGRIEEVLFCELFERRDSKVYKAKCCISKVISLNMMQVCKNCNISSTTGGNDSVNDICRYCNELVFHSKVQINVIAHDNTYQANFFLTDENAWNVIGVNLRGELIKILVKYGKIEYHKGDLFVGNERMDFSTKFKSKAENILFRLYNSMLVNNRTFWIFYSLVKIQEEHEIKIDVKRLYPITNVKEELITQLESL